MHPLILQYLTTLGMNEEQARAALTGWTVSTAMRHGEPAAIMLTQGSEIHMVSLNDRKALSRRIIAEFLNPLIEEYGYATTKVPIAVEDHTLRTRLGFQCTWQDANFTYWAVTEIPYQRK